MTIVSTIITDDLTVQAADSMLSQPKYDSNGRLVGFSTLRRRARKIVRIPAYAGSMSFWGLATLGWRSTHSWLSWQVSQARNRSPQQFADVLASNLQTDLSKMNLSENSFYGIGIHFTAYENGIPELFLITNYLDTSYTKVDRNKIHVSRETYLHIPGNDQSNASLHSAPHFRNKVQDYLKQSPWNWLIFNNGDPEMFNPLAQAIVEEIRISGQRANLNTSERLQLLKTVVTMPIEVVSKIQQSVYRADRQLVGTPVRWLAMRPSSTYESTTGD